ncbi:SGNH/GDSL hydrolase family protein [Streptomyces pseudovenezuelae]|uniref:Lysophospholipase L1-like esterase n=1 Tax=Streptomyces pseudovenezuelae TaxID=67350 RepID=A0ABT6LZ85_9ACTN|nr:SGNH/GDSL hydrolase family protein [Streptomyces pseudovenezuelae]MDH6221155.1 lysophospholipase L1-like esterase [Streptomyces pseudovenezuelae]
MARLNGYALLSAIVALIVGMSAAIYVGVAADDGRTSTHALGAGGAPHNSAAPVSTGTWVGSWSASPAGAEPGTETYGLAGRSVRNVVHASVGGTGARVTLSNLYGQSALTLTNASIAVAATSRSAAATAQTMLRLTFGGATTVVIPAGGQVLSDAVRIVIPQGGDVLVTTYSPTASGPVTYHPHARQISYVADGDLTEDVSGAAYTQQTAFWRYLTALDVLSNESDGTVVAFGDSLTDGISSTTDANHRWTDVLAQRLRTAVESGRDVPRYSVINQGISGNQILTDGLGRPADNQSGLERFARDALSRTNVKVVIIDLGVNDILRNPRLADPDRILDGLRALVRQAHARGIKVVGATLMPFRGHRGYSGDRDGVRQEVNAMIRSGTVFDAVVDFDRALRDPYDPRRLRSDYDSGDHLHPSDKGYARMAEVFDLDDLKGSAPAEL